MDLIQIPTFVESDDLLPTYATPLASGADARAAISEPIVIQPGSTALIPTGLKLELPPGYEIQVRPRSGLALKSSITVLNTPGTVDSDYRGEIGIILINHGKEPFTVTARMRIAQLVLAPVVQAEFIRVEAMVGKTTRGDGGFGHTGIH